ncbi:MAG: YraN family protein [Clostridia bacterium]|nr:YraN family protein [Clostridia bacterium]
MNIQGTGKAGEDAAAAYLVKKGYRIAERNYNCRIAEIDIVAYDENDTLCFIEVKTRKNSDFGYPGEYVDRRKQQKIRLGAASFIKHKRIDCEIRFDVVEVYAYMSGDTPKITRINHIENAF